TESFKMQTKVQIIATLCVLLVQGLSIGNIQDHTNLIQRRSNAYGVPPSVAEVPTPDAQTSVNSQQPAVEDQENSYDPAGKDQGSTQDEALPVDDKTTPENEEAVNNPDETKTNTQMDTQNGSEAITDGQGNAEASPQGSPEANEDADNLETNPQEKPTEASKKGQCKHKKNQSVNTPSKSGTENTEPEAPQGPGSVDETTAPTTEAETTNDLPESEESVGEPNNQAPEDGSSVEDVGETQLELVDESNNEVSDENSNEEKVDGGNDEESDIFEDEVDEDEEDEDEEDEGEGEGEVDNSTNESTTEPTGEDENKYEANTVGSNTEEEISPKPTQSVKGVYKSAKNVY
ncbi:hypothetical protein L0F63_003855, partial [Massospora cicadina]